MTSHNLYRKVEANKSVVFVNHSLITDQQLRQIMSSTKVVLKPEDIVPKLKIKAMYLTNKCIVHKSRNRRPVLNHKNQTNDLNVENNVNHKNENTTKRKLRSDSIKDNNRYNDKKMKSDLKQIGGNAFNTSNKSNVNQKKNKENENNCNTELSRVIGLPNMGNTCYINSIIQVLRMTPGFRKFVCDLNKAVVVNKSPIQLKKSNQELISSLHNVFVHFGDNEMNVNSSDICFANNSKITQLIECEDIKNRFEFGQQQDCHEFLNWLINELNTFAERLSPNKDISRNSVKTVYNTRQRNRRESMSFQSFQGVMIRNIMCNECQRDSSTLDSFADIQIPLCFNEEENNSENSESQTFTEIIHRKDYLKDDNMFDCGHCSKKTNASVVNSIKTPPKVLIIFIKKPFEYNSVNTRSIKPMKRLFTVPLCLEYLLNNSDNCDKQVIKYSLYGFVMHNGSDIDNGHYYAVIDSGLPDSKRSAKISCNCDLNVLSNNGWIKVNDHKVHKLNSSHLNKLLDNDSISSTPYLAFYRRND